MATAAQQMLSRNNQLTNANSKDFRSDKIIRGYVSQTPPINLSTTNVIIRSRTPISLAFQELNSYAPVLNTWNF